ncbi:hypothetical protein Selin_2583 [Desulfurispirillum indicum S5]|uniref:Uncharacterized protein n=1 Tax=Desulfurispirillum indicum (strain ATCC BAA-1389 / DSM 22839 / S5) TaxID=653733 RepID=E6W6F9_DESIS|nr:hypothetical protein Selin_2583 [Desulfurispirillum indicum S5]
MHRILCTFYPGAPKSTQKRAPQRPFFRIVCSPVLEIRQQAAQRGPSAALPVIARHCDVQGVDSRVRLVEREATESVFCCTAYFVSLLLLTRQKERKSDPQCCPFQPPACLELGTANNRHPWLLVCGCRHRGVNPAGLPRSSQRVLAGTTHGGEAEEVSSLQ